MQIRSFLMLMFLWASANVFGQVTPTRPLNDTGITSYGDASSNNLATEPADYPGQDARYGRDAQAGAVQLAKIGGGSKGFDFTKIANDGTELPETAALGADAKDWACTRDNVTGVMWEVKTTSGLHSQSHTYTWYNSDSATNGGIAGGASGGSCNATGRCDTEKFVQDVNAVGLCGHGDWRMPNADELMSIVDYGRYIPAIDSAWFPNTSASSFWSASTALWNSIFANVVSFYFGDIGTAAKSGVFNGVKVEPAYQVRLVRAL